MCVQKIKMKTFLIMFKVQGIDHFRHEVVFAKVDFPESDSESRFSSLWTSLSSRLLSSGFIKSRDADITDFKRHVTLLKMSRDKNLKKMKLKKIPEDLYKSRIADKFGNECFHSVQLLSMTKPGKVKCKWSKLKQLKCMSIAISFKI